MTKFKNFISNVLLRTNLHALGTAPAHLSPEEQWIWTDLVRVSHPANFTNQHRLCFEVLCKMVFRMRRSQLELSELDALMHLLCKFGMTPSIR